MEQAIYAVLEVRVIAPDGKAFNAAEVAAQAARLVHDLLGADFDVEAEIVEAGDADAREADRPSGEPFPADLVNAPCLIDDEGSDA